jgi:hypothetical protein
MDTIRNVTQLLIGADVALTALTDLDPITSPAQLADGEIVITDQFNRYLDGSSAATNGLIKFAQRSGNELVWSDVINIGTLKQYAITPAAAETQQVDYVGYNGVSGALDEIASNIYTVRLYYQESLIAGFMQQKIKEGFYKSNATAASYTQRAVAKGLQESLIKNFSREAEKDIAFERINSGAADAALGNLTLTQGSKYFVSAIDDTANISAGDVVRLGGTGAGTAPCYVVVGHDGGAGAARVYELDVPWQGATVAALAAAETVTEADWGLQLQGVDRLFSLGKFASRVAHWKTTIDFGDAAVATVTSTGAYEGVGTGQQISTLEKELQADNYVYRGFSRGADAPREDAVQTNTADYDVQVLEYEHVLEAAQGTPTKSPKTLQIAWKTAGNAVAADVVAVQELLFTAGGFAYVSQAANLT